MAFDNMFGTSGPITNADTGTSYSRPPTAQIMQPKKWFEELEESRPQWNSLVGSSGFLDPKYQVGDVFDQNRYTSGLNRQLSRINLDKRGLNKFRDEALRDGPSAWQNLMLERQKLEEQQGRDDVGALSSSQAAQARSALATRGGLTSGAAERLAGGASREAMMARQRLAGEGMRSRADISTQDEANRIAQLSQLPGMEVQSLQPAIARANIWQSGQRDILTGQQSNRQADQWNIEQALDEQKAKREQEQARWRDQTTNRAAERQATATENSGK